MYKAGVYCTTELVDSEPKLVKNREFLIRIGGIYSIIMYNLCNWLI